jgi:hypothetical protein
VFPAALMHPTQFVIGDVRVVEREQGVLSLRLKRERHDRLESACVSRHPSVLNLPWSIENRKAAVVG